MLAAAEAIDSLLQEIRDSVPERITRRFQGLFDKAHPIPYTDLIPLKRRAIRGSGRLGARRSIVLRQLAKSLAAQALRLCPEHQLVGQRHPDRCHPRRHPVPQPPHEDPARMDLCHVERRRKGKQHCGACREPAAGQFLAFIAHSACRHWQAQRRRDIPARSRDGVARLRQKSGNDYTDRTRPTNRRCYCQVETQTSMLSTEHQLVMALHRISQANDRYSRQLLRECSLTAPQLATFREIMAGQNRTPSTLADAFRLSQPTVTGILLRLEDRGLVKREKSEQDRRSTLVTITAEGKQIAENAPPLLRNRVLAPSSANCLIGNKPSCSPTCNESRP